MILRNLDVNFKMVVFTVIISFHPNIFFTQNQTEYLLQGTWKLEQVISSEKTKQMTLNIKYSEDYNRYFGNITSYGSVATLDSIFFNKETKKATFSSHIRNRDMFILTIQNNEIEGTVWSKEKNYPITGEKTSNSNLNSVLEYGDYKPTKIPDNIEDLYLETGNINSNTILLVIQGGPFNKIQYTNEFDKWKNKLHIVFVKQSQIINPTILPPENNLTLESAYNENLVTVEMLHKVIQHFKNKNKKVLVWGVSYGAWIIQKYMAEYNIGADAVSISAGRLDIEEEIWKNGSLNQTAYNIVYKKNEITYSKMEFSYPKPLSYMLASITKEKFTKSLKKKDLSKLVLYQYGENDGTVGRLNKSEKDFLKLKNVEIEVCNKCYHRQMLSEKIINSAIQKMLDFINK